MVMVTVEILEIEVLFCTYVWVTSYILMVEKAIKKKVCRNTRCAFFFFIDYKNRLIIKLRYFEDFFDLCVLNI